MQEIRYRLFQQNRRLKTIAFLEKSGISEKLDKIEAHLWKLTFEKKSSDEQYADYPRPICFMKSPKKKLSFRWILQLVP